MTFVQMIVAVPGFLALLGLGVGWGILQQKVRALEQKMERFEKLAEVVGRIDERTESGRSQLDKIDSRIDIFLATLLGEARSFREAVVRPTPGGRG